MTMTDDVQAQEAETTNALGDDAAQVENNNAGGDESQQERDYEAEAREMGWVPQDDFRGPKNAWKDAEAFVKDGETILPIVREQNKRLREELFTKDSEFEKRIARMEKMQQKSMESLKANYEREMARIKGEQEQAVSEGDVERFRALDKEREDLAKKSVETGSDPADDNETVQREWIAANSWYKTDFEMNRTATEYSQFLAQADPNITMADNLAKVTEYMKGKYPEKFGGKAKTNGHAAVDSPTFSSGFGGKRQKGYSDLPSEAKQMCAQDIEDGLYKDKEAWAKEYFNG